MVKWKHGEELRYMSVGSVSDFVKGVVPISRFNRGEASRVFDEVKRDGIKVVMKNNDPSCVLVSLDKYLELEEKLENCQLMLEAIRREKEAENIQPVKQADALLKFGYTHDELSENDVEIE